MYKSHNNVELFKDKLIQNKICIGAGVTLSDPLSTEIAAEAGNDFVWLEMEHSHLTNNDLIVHIMALRGTKTAAMVRVPWNDPVIIKPIIDMCPAVIVVPMIRNASDALKAVQSCKYPPNGFRSFSPIRNMYSCDDMGDYLNIADSQTMVFVQIEHIDAINDLDNILKTPGLDGLVLGRNDLSGSVDKLGDYDNPLVKDAINTFFKKSKCSNVFTGCAVSYDPSIIDEWYEKGCQFFNIGCDREYIYSMSKDIVNKIRSLDQND